MTADQDPLGRLWRTTDELNRLAKEHRDPLVRDLAEEVIFTRGLMHKARSQVRELTKELEELRLFAGQSIFATATLMQTAAKGREPK